MKELSVNEEMVQRALLQLKQLKDRASVCKNITFDVLHSQGKNSDLLIECHKEMINIAEVTEKLLERTMEKVQNAERVS